MRDAGANSFQLLLETPRECAVTENLVDLPVGYIVECNDFTWIVGYKSGTQVFSKGVLRAAFVTPLPSRPGEPRLPVKIQSMEYIFEHHTDFVKRSAIVGKSMSPSSSRSRSTTKVTGAYTPPVIPECGSPLKLADKKSLKRSRVDLETEPAVSDHSRQSIKIMDYANFPQSPHSTQCREMSLPPPAVGPAGVSDRAMRILEVKSTPAIKVPLQANLSCRRLRSQ